MKAAELDSIKTLLATGANIDGVGERASPLISLRTPLWIAVSEAGATMSQHLKNLVEAAQNCDPTLPPRDLAKERELAVSVVKLLLESGANVENPCWGTTPLWQATHWNDPEVAELLLSAGADPNAESVSPLSKLATKKGRTTIPGYFNTVLHDAVQNGATAIVKMLLDAGALPLKKNHEDKTSIDLAEEKGFSEIKELLLKAVKRT